MITVVPLSKYCEISGEEKRAVEGRIERGIWQIGKQVCKMPGVRERWIDLLEVEKWARNQGTCRVA